MEINEGTSKSNDDIIQAFEVFNNVFGNISNEQFVNKHYNNPERLNKAIYYMKENGKMIGINGFMGCVLHKKNITIRTAQSCDTAVLDEYRGKGIFTKIVSAAENGLKEEGVQVLIGLPNDNSYYGFKKMGWKDLEETRTVVLRLDIMNARGKKGRFFDWIDRIWNMCKLFLIYKNMLASYKVKIDEKFPFDEEEISSINVHDEFTFYRNQNYYRWRLDKKNVKYLRVYENNKLVGYIIFRKADDGIKRIVEIIDWWMISYEKKSILARMIYEVHKIYKGYILFPFLNSEGKELKILQQLGFIINKKDKHRIIYKILDENLGTDIMHKKLQIRLLDVDTFVNCDYEN